MWGDLRPAEDLRKYGIPKDTIGRKAKEFYSLNLGSQTSLSPAEETKLVCEEGTRCEVYRTDIKTYYSKDGVRILKGNGSPGTRYNRPKRAWFNEEIFEDWFNSLTLSYSKKFLKEYPNAFIGDNQLTIFQYQRRSAQKNSKKKVRIVLGQSIENIGIEDEIARKPMRKPYHLDSTKEDSDQFFGLPEDFSKDIKEQYANLKDLKIDDFLLIELAYNGFRKKKILERCIFKIVLYFGSFCSYPPICYREMWTTYIPYVDPTTSLPSFYRYAWKQCLRFSLILAIVAFPYNSLLLFHIN
ncbi:hypothetical protein ILUMI_21408 [Ignelater luminosus]|uniref:Uncharacterized protein n=1 Tax=Ignelater luminosus TaxID=2038154 RepID=A0A8K0CHT6_IGNLU|nr:hypothetical protein ILUMI_21408 [Ignelater luminosus]